MCGECSWSSPFLIDSETEETVARNLSYLIILLNQVESIVSLF